MATTEITKIITIEEEIRKCPDVRIEHLQIFRDWVKGQPHFPPFDDDLTLLQFLRRCRNSIEKAKIKFDNYLTFRTHFPELCANRTIDHPDIQEMLSTWQIVILRKRDQNGNLVLVERALTPDSTRFNPNTQAKIVMTIFECYLREHGTIPGYVIVYDCGNLGIGHLAKCSLTLCRQILYFIQKCAPASIKGAYAVNASSVVDTALTFFKSVTNGNMINKVQPFREGAIEGLYEYLPREILPKEYGGYGDTMDELHRDTCEYLQRMGAYATAMDKLKVDERKRQGVKVNFGSIFGVEGSFKKLEVD